MDLPMLTPLEKAVLELILDKPGEPFDTARTQLTHAIVGERKFTGVGFFTHFTVPSDAQVRRDLPDATIGDVGAQFPELKNGAGFLLFIRGGVISMLEAYTYDEEWPTNTDEFKVEKVTATKIPKQP
jgi:hypothetical protein